MNEEKARKILGDWIQDDGGLYCLGIYLHYNPGDGCAVLDAEFSLEELQAIVWWMENN